MRRTSTSSLFRLFANSRHYTTIAQIRNQLFYSNRVIRWTATGQAEFPYITEIYGTKLKLRLNDYPAEPFATVLWTENGEEKEINSVNDYPKNWDLPSNEPSNIPKGL